MKWGLIIVLIFVIMLIAYAVSEQYKEKFDFYNNLKTFLQQFKINVSFRQEKITDFLKNIKAKKQFNLFIKEYQNYLKNNEINFKEIKILEEEEKNQLEMIIKNIGKYDAKNEINQLDSFLIEVDEKLKKAEADKNKLCPMILKLSLLFAIGLAILLI
ncbi:MAG: hypothetical protein IJ415_00110 [Clostridia bacterium]|nr:hypothetical protein [Clostridia bacterium]